MRVPFIIPDGGGFVKLDAGWIFRYHGPDDEVMTMQYLCAPMEGVTGDLFRQAQRQTFPAADSYYTPFLSPTANRTFSPRELREIEPAHNAGIRVVPQLMGHCAEDFLWMAGQLADMGYDEVNFNLGCPSNTVTVKKKGAGLLTEPDLLRRFFDAVFAACPLPVSVKTRLGKTTAAPFPALHDRLYAATSARIPDRRALLFRMKEAWRYLGCSFADAERPLRRIRKAQDMIEYESAVRQLFASCPVRENAGYFV